MTKDGIVKLADFGVAGQVPAKIDLASKPEKHDAHAEDAATSGDSDALLMDRESGAHPEGSGIGRLTKTTSEPSDMSNLRRQSPQTHRVTSRKREKPAAEGGGTKASAMESLGGAYGSGGGRGSDVEQVTSRPRKRRSKSKASAIGTSMPTTESSGDVQEPFGSPYWMAPGALFFRGEWCFCSFRGDAPVSHMGVCS